MSTAEFLSVVESVPVIICTLKAYMLYVHEYLYEEHTMRFLQAESTYILLHLPILWAQPN